jgi:hypothetical protein
MMQELLNNLIIENSIKSKFKNLKKLGHALGIGGKCSMSKI